MVLLASTSAEEQIVEEFNFISITLMSVGHTHKLEIYVVSLHTSTYLNIKTNELKLQAQFFHVKTF